MLEFRPEALCNREREDLAERQVTIDSLPSYDQRVRTAIDKWKASLLGSARDKLRAARPGGDRCVFCEDSEGRDVEHFLPRALFPESTWRWENLVCACSGCNGPKGTRHAILSGAGSYIEVTRRRNAPVVPPPEGISAWIDPRAEDPMRLIELDILGNSFYFIARDGLPPADAVRVEWTVEECLELNKREALVQARKNAFFNYRARLREYVHKKNSGAQPRELSLLRDDLRQENHPTVWAELKRQREELDDIPEFFADAPEALSW